MWSINDNEIGQFSFNAYKRRSAYVYVYVDDDGAYALGACALVERNWVVVCCQISQITFLFPFPFSSNYGQYRKRGRQFLPNRRRAQEAKRERSKVQLHWRRMHSTVNQSLGPHRLAKRQIRLCCWIWIQCQTYQSRGKITLIQEDATLWTSLELTRSHLIDSKSSKAIQGTLWPCDKFSTIIGWGYSLDRIMGQDH